MDLTHCLEASTLDICMAMYYSQALTDQLKQKD